MAVAVWEERDDECEWHERPVEDLTPRACHLSHN
jgi:hypothetical protein